jgi:hypothetical protein
MEAICFFAIVISLIGNTRMLKRAAIILTTPFILCSQLNVPLNAASNIKADSTDTPSKGPFADIQPLEQMGEKKNLYRSSINKTVLKGSVSETAKASPFLYGKIETIPKGTKLNLSIMGNLNSQLSKVGDEIIARVSLDVNNGDKVLLPGGWYMHGKVTESTSQKRLGRDGYVTVEFDKLISPDGDTDLPFKSTFSTKDNELKAISKTVLIDSGYVGIGALGGSIISAQLTGIPLAISTYGISIGAGAAVGGSLGLIGALKRKGKIASFFPGDEMTITTAEPIIVPGFDARFIPSAQPTKALADLKITTNGYKFGKDPFGDKQSRQLLLSVTIRNNIDRAISFFDLVVLSDYGERYYPSLTTVGLSTFKTKVKPNTTVTAEVAFNVSHKKHKYWLILLDKANKEEIARCPIN